MRIDILLWFYIFKVLMKLNSSVFAFSLGFSRNISVFYYNQLIIGIF